MKKDVVDIPFHRLQEALPAIDNFYLSADHFVSLDISPLNLRHLLQPDEPYYLHDGNVAIATSGEACAKINMVDVSVKRNDLLYIPAKSTIEIHSRTEDVNFMAFSFRNIQLSRQANNFIQLHLSPDEQTLFSTYIRLLCHSIATEDGVHVYDRLAEAIIENVFMLHDRFTTSSTKKNTRNQELLHQFFDLLNQQHGRQRNPAFFADKLSVTANYLGKVIKQESGEPMMKWVNRSVIQQAKIDLKHTSLPIYAIADKLLFSNPSFFNKFFKRETGMTPKQYREL